MLALNGLASGTGHHRETGLNRQGPEAVRHILDAHGLAPGAYRFPVKLTDEVTDAEFMESARAFEEECPRAIAAGYKTCLILSYLYTSLSVIAYSATTI